ncbi:PREDICTED: uncharacterized protein LOC101314759 [Fragaria vesca subsp. vesca]|uniref:uncharacterized protein LOC101314759 n=1 Tax=Fragaria vesca subsp. vesca TaxID=101020 RepID=UPI0002C33683|nr:PREDICTED: uncharacterized protein LOC101314759 [Fragaria vesca subsp. vesca]
MATATANLLIQTNTWKRKQSYPNLLRPLPAARLVNLRPTFNQLKLKAIVSPAAAQKKSHLITNPTQSLLQPTTVEKIRPPNKLWKALKKPVTAVVLLGLLLMHRPKPALAGSVGRIGATCSPWDSPPKSESRKRFEEAMEVNMEERSFATVWIIMYPIAAYYCGLAVLFVLCRLLKLVDPSWLDSANDRTKYLLVLLILHYAWVTTYDPVTVFKLNLQANLSNTGRALQTDLNRIAENPNTSTYEGLNSILTETAVAFLRHSDCFISASSFVAEKYGMKRAQKYLSQLSLEETNKLREKPFVNVKNLIAESSTSQKSANEVQEEYMEVTILVAVEGRHKLPTINSVDDLKKVLRKLASIDPDGNIYVYGVEVLWHPQSSLSRTRL